MRLSKSAVKRKILLRRRVAKTYKTRWFTLYAWLKIILVPYEQISRFVPRSGNVLDIGCGYGILSLFLALESAERFVQGINSNARRISTIGRILNLRPNNVEFKCFDIGMMVEDEFFDCIVMEEVLHHVPKNEQQGVLSTVKNILRYDGVFVLRENNKRLSFRYLFVNLPAEYILYSTEEKATSVQLLSLGIC